MSALAGVASVTIDGNAFNLVSDARWSPSTVKRETLAGQDGIHGFKETPIAPFMSFKIRDGKGMSIAAFNAMRDVTVVLQLASGKIVVGRNMWSVDPQEVDAMEGAFDVKFEGQDVQEL